MEELELIKMLALVVVLVKLSHFCFSLNDEGYEAIKVKS